MKVAFWGSTQKSDCVTANLAAISIVWAFSYASRIAVTANHWNGFGIREMLGGAPARCIKKREENFFYGEPAFDRRRAEKQEREKIFLEDKLRYVPMQRSEQQPFCCTSFLWELEQLSLPDEVWFIDTAHGSMNTQVILQEAELVVVSLVQETDCVERFLAEYTPLLSKTVFVIGNYHKTSEWNAEYLQKRYRLPKQKIGRIPHNGEYAQAIEEGRTIEFFMRNFNCNRNHVNYSFIKESKRAAGLLYEALFPLECGKDKRGL